MTNNLACHAGDIVLLRAEIIGVGSDGPYVRVEIGSGGATCFWAPTSAITQIERGFDAPNETTGLSRWNGPDRLSRAGTQPADVMNLARQLQAVA
jgi:hypothetical protein